MSEGCGIVLDFHPREYSIRELFDAYKRKEITLSPKFQRRAVWEYKAKSYLIDSIITGIPVPRIFVRECTNLDMSANREVIDGQQRLKTIFDFLDDGFKISKTHSKEYGDCYYSDLNEEIQRDFLKYPISAVLLIDVDDNTIFDIFARLNTYSVKLNPQELLNSQYFGLYKQLVYKLAQEYRSFWVDSGLLTEKSISRMDDAKLVSDLISVIIKEKIESNSPAQTKQLYLQYDDNFPQYNEIESRFKTTLDLFSKIYDIAFSETEFSNVPVFYSAFLALYHMNYPIGCFTEHECKLDATNIPKAKTALDEINNILNTDDSDLSTAAVEFKETTKRNTTTPAVRITRCNYIVYALIDGLGA